MRFWFWALVVILSIAVGLLVPVLRRQPSGSFARRLVTEIGPRPTGPQGRWTRRDRLRAAGLWSLAAAGCIALSILVLSIGDRWTNLPTLNRAFWYAGMLFFGAGLGSVVATLFHLGAAPFASGSPDRSPEA